jgi:hypothetical protein
MSEQKECSGCGEPIPESGKQCACKKPRAVVCAANRSRVTGKIIAGARHWDSIMRQQVNWLDPSSNNGRQMPDEWAGAEQGFIDQYGQWMTREEAWKVAEANNQIKFPSGWDKGTLYSEDLY